MRKVIYEPKGPAREYAPLAVNLFNGCIHGCKYCYVPQCLHISREKFHSDNSPRDNILEDLEAQAKTMQGDPREILLCFTCDPYQDRTTAKTTRQALKILGENKLKATVLTKGGMSAVRDFDLLIKYKFSLGISISFSNDKTREEWEPNAAPLFNRIGVILEAHRRGIFTWVSLEPIIYPDQALYLIRFLTPCVDHFKIGKINHNKELEVAIDWHKFYCDVTKLLDSIGADYYIKESLKRYA